MLTDGRRVGLFVAIGSTFCTTDLGKHPLGHALLQGSLSPLPLVERGCWVGFSSAVA